MANEHIVVIDDDKDMQTALSLMLAPAGYRVTLCSTAQEGWNAIRRDPPDLILLDVMLTSPSEGFHLAYALRRDETFEHTPIIMISAIGERMGVDYARELGSEYLPVERFLDKPLSPATVLSAVRECLTSRSTSEA